MEPVKTVTFSRYYPTNFGYSCSIAGDQSGEYVPLADFETISNLQAENEQLKATLAKFRDNELSYVFQFEKIEKALGIDGSEDWFTSVTEEVKRLKAELATWEEDAGAFERQLDVAHAEIQRLKSEQQDVVAKLKSDNAGLEEGIAGLVRERDELSEERIKYNHGFEYREELEFSNDESFIDSWAALFISISIYPDGSYCYNSLIPHTTVYRVAKYARRPYPKEPEFLPEKGEPVLAWQYNEEYVEIMFFKNKIESGYNCSPGISEQCALIKMKHIKPLPGYQYKNQK